MLIDLSGIYSDRVKEINLDQDITFTGELYQIPDIKQLKNIHLRAKISKEEEEVLLKGILDGTMVIADTISLEDVDYDFSISLEENIDEIIENNTNSIDILDILWQNIVLEVPLRYTEVTDYSQYSGDGWRLISEEELASKNNPFQILKENKKEE